MSYRFAVIILPP